MTRHLMLAASDGQITPTIQAAAAAYLAETIADVAAEHIVDRYHLWNPDTDMVIATEHATPDDWAECEAATQRLYARAEAGEPLTDSQTQMLAAVTRVQARRNQEAR